MAQYTVLERSFIDNHLVEEGEVVTLDDSVEVGSNLELVPGTKAAPSK